MTTLISKYALSVARILAAACLVAVLSSGLSVSDLSFVHPVSAQETTQPANPDSPQELKGRAKLDSIRLELDQIEAGVQRSGVSENVLSSARERLEDIALSSRAILDEATPRADAIRARLKELGPKPDPTKAGVESPDVSREREERERTLKEIDETVRLARAVALQADQTIAEVADKRRANFTSELFRRSESLLAPSLWLKVAMNLPGDARALLGMVGDTAERIKGGLGWTGILVILGVFIGALSLRPLAQRLASRIADRYKTGPEPSDLVKALRALILTLASVALPGAAAFLVYQITVGFGALPPRVEPVVATLLGGLVFIAASTGLAYGLFAPNIPRMRMFLIPNEVAERLVRLVVATALLLVVSRLVETINQAIAAALPLTVATRGIFSVIIALNLMRALNGLKPFDECDEAAFGQYVDTKGPWAAAGRTVLWAVLAIVLVAAILGYVALASFLIDQIAWAAVIAAGFVLLNRLVRGGVDALIAPNTRAERALQSSVGLSRPALMQLSILTVGAVQLLLAGFALLLLLAPWGVQSSDLLFSLRAALFGFTIGDVTISFATIFLALGVFGGGILLTRAIQSWLRTRYLPQTQLDSGLKNSITTGLGYVGFVAAIYFSLTSLGLSLDRLAIVAGALSVGIGFGLQSIVNNFVSGLILLWERSIRVGDLVVIGEDQGFVRRINVRSTEIETFDRATVIVPNSNLVSGVVKNRVHTDRVGRVLVSIPMPRDVDPDVMAGLMREAAVAHDEVLEDPGPRVLFRKAGESMLEFDLIAFVAEVEVAGRVSSDLTFAIWRQIRAQKLLPAPPPTLKFEAVGALAEAILGAPLVGQKATGIDGASKSVKE